MQVNELNELADWINISFANTNIISKYNSLISVLTANNRPNTTKKPFANEKNALIAETLNLSFKGLNSGQINVLESLGIKNNLGVQGKKKIDSIFTANSSDFVTIINELKLISTNMNRALVWSNSILPNLKLSFPKIESARPLNMVSVRVTFKGDTNLDNFSDIERWSKKWQDIARGVAMSEDEAPESFKIIGASTGSIAIFVGTTVYLARGLAWLVKEIMDRVEQLDRIRLQKEELTRSKFDTKAAEDALAKIQDDEKERLAEAMILAKFGPQSEDDKTGDIRVAFGHSAEILFEFLSADGEIEFKLPESTNEEGASDQDFLEAFNQLDQLNDSINKARLGDGEIINLPAPDNTDA